jgi:formylglycine-generating enzyme required for sulfatase activity
MGAFLLFTGGLLFSGCSSDEAPTVAEPTGPGPHIPEFLIVSSTSPTFLRLTWEDVSDDELGFTVERSLQLADGYAVIDTVAADVATYTDGTVEAGGRYYYRVRSYDSEVQSEPTAAVGADAVTNATPALPSSPLPGNGSLDILPGMRLSWRGGDPDGDPVTYDVFLSTTLAEVPVVGTVVGDTSLVPPDSLQLNRRYFWRVKATDPGGASALSPIWGFAMKIERIVVPGGYFVMGDVEDSPHPGNPIWVDAFSMDKFEVTNQQYADFLTEAARRRLIRREGGLVKDIAGEHIWFELGSADADSRIFYDTDRRIYRVEPGWESHPAIEVSWYGAKAFAALFNRRLPSEAEWEMAARGTGTDLGDTTFIIEVAPDSSAQIAVGLGRPFPWGLTISPSHANYQNSGDPFESRLGVGTTPVGFFDGTTRGGFPTIDNSNEAGVYDLAGNVYEWTEDWQGAYRKPHAPPVTGHLKVIRGGSWRKTTESALTWNRTWTFPDSTDNSIGFRTAGLP